MKKEYVVFSLFVLSFVGFCSSLSLAKETESLDKERIIQSVRENHSLFDSVEYKIEQDLFLDISEGFLQLLKTGGQIRFDGKKCWARWASCDAGTTVENVRIKEKLIDSDDVKLLRFRNKDENQEFRIIDRTAPIPHDVIDTALSNLDKSDDLRYSLLSWLSPVKYEAYPYEISAGFEKGLFIGDGKEYLKIAELMEHCDDVLWDEQEEKNLVLFRWSDDSGLFYAWFDPECHYLLVKFRYAANKMLHGKLSVHEYQVIDKNAQGDNFYPCKYEFKQYLCPTNEITDNTVTDFSDQWLFAKIICTLSDCNFSPKFDKSSFCFSRPIEENTPAGMQDAPGVPYVWTNGQFVPYKTNRR